MWKKNPAYSVLTSKLDMGFINKGWYGMFFACDVWCTADVSSVN